MRLHPPPRSPPRLGGLDSLSPGDTCRGQELTQNWLRLSCSACPEALAHCISADTRERRLSFSTSPRPTSETRAAIQGASSGSWRHLVVLDTDSPGSECPLPSVCPGSSGRFESSIQMPVRGLSPPRGRCSRVHRGTVLKACRSPHAQLRPDHLQVSPIPVLVLWCLFSQPRRGQGSLANSCSQLHARPTGSACEHPDPLTSARKGQGTMEAGACF